MTTLTPVEEERAAQARLRATRKRAKAVAAMHERERWSKVKEILKGERCRCKIERGMTFDDLIEANLRGPAGERLNCCDPHYICPTLTKVLDIARGGKL